VAKNPTNQGEMTNLPNGRPITWAEYRLLLQQITREQVLQYQQSQGKQPKGDK
jgi:hypothetical protein